MKLLSLLFVLAWTVSVTAAQEKPEPVILAYTEASCAIMGKWIPGACQQGIIVHVPPMPEAFAFEITVFYAQAAKNKTQARFTRASAKGTTTWFKINHLESVQKVVVVPLAQIGPAIEHSAPMQPF